MIRTILIFASLASLALPGANASAEDAREITNSIGVKLVRIEPGSFTMGQDGPASDYKTSLHPDKIDDADWDEQPAHRVTITKAFFMGVSEVTIGQYRQSDSDFRKDQPGDEAVSAISW